MGSQGYWGSRHIIIFIQQRKSLTGLVSYVQHYWHSTLTSTLLGSLGYWGTGSHHLVYSAGKFTQGSGVVHPTLQALKTDLNTSKPGLSPACWLGALPFFLKRVSLCARAEAVDGV